MATITPPMIPQCAFKEKKESMWKGFFSLTGGSIWYCLSALSIIYGIANMLGPLLAQTDVLRDALPCLGALNLYEIALLGVLCFIVIKVNVTDDAVSLVVLVALFLVASGLALTTVANSGKNAALFIGGLFLALGLLKLYVLRRRIGIKFTPVMLVGLGIILAWNFGAASIMTSVIPPGGAARGHLLKSWLFLLAGAAAILWAAIASISDHSHAGKKLPFLLDRGMPLVFACIVLLAGGVHQYVLGYVFDITTLPGEYLPLACIISMIILSLSLSLSAKHDGREIVLALLPMSFVFYALLIRWGGLAPATGLGIFWHPPFLLGVSGIIIFWMWLKKGVAFFPLVSGVYFLAVVLTYGFSSGPITALNWRAAGAILTACFFAAGLMRRNAVLCVLAVLLFAAGTSTTGMFGRFTAASGMNAFSIFMGLTGAGIIAVAMLFGRKTHVALTLAGSIGLTVFMFNFFHARITADAAGLIGIIIILIIAAAIWFRMRQWLPVAVLLLPAAQKLWLLSTKFTAWRFVVLSFVLLFVGAWASIWKGRRNEQNKQSNDNSNTSSESD